MKKNIKLISWVLIIISLYFIWDLFWFSGELGGGSSGWIGGLGSIPRYNWFLNSFIALCIIGILFYILLNKYKFQEKSYISILFGVMLFSIFSKQIFFILSPDFGFYFGGNNSYYNTENKEINHEIYQEKYLKYCIDKQGWKFLSVGNRNTMCMLNGKVINDLNNENDYIKMFDFANKINDRKLYYRIYLGADRFGLENIIDKYNDLTFQAYIIKSNGDINTLATLNGKINNNELKSILIVSQEQISYLNDNFYGLKYDERNNLIQSNYSNVYKKLTEVDGVNTKVF